MTEKYELKHDTVEMVEYPSELRKSVGRAAGLWQEFCRLPDEIKLRFLASDNQWAVGYEVKNGEGVRGDRKENFDYLFSGSEGLDEIVASFDEPTVRQFIESVKTLQKHVTPMIEQFGARVEAAGVEGFSDLAGRSVHKTCFRFLHYPGGREVGATIAQPHVDHSGFTFHLFETTDGCERLSFMGEWVSLPVDSGHAAAFGGMQTQLVSQSEIKAMSHRVVANQESARIGRYAIVCFVTLDGVPIYDKASHGRLQEMPAGFNYTISQADFSRLFK